MKICCEMIADLVEDGYQLVLTHGNGPQVGSIVIQNEAAGESVPENPLDVCGAQTQDEETRIKYKSDFRHIVDYLACMGDREKCREYI